MVGGLLMRGSSVATTPTPAIPSPVATAPAESRPTAAPAAGAALPTSSVQATALLAATQEPGWIAIGGTWNGLDDGVVHGETAEASDGLYLHQQTYADFTFSGAADSIHAKD